MVLTARVGNFKVNVLDDDAYIGPCLLRGYEWDGWMRHDLPKIYKSRTDILDIGGNIGWNALMFSDYGPVHTFEPIFHQIITDNVNQNSLQDKITVYPFGLSDSPDTVKMWLPKKESGIRNYGGSTLHPTDAHSDESVSVVLKRLDDVYTGRVSVMKVDVEGHELAVLKGAQQTILKNKPAIYIEMFDESKAPIKEFLENELGYTTFIPRPEHNFLCLTKEN